MVVEVDCLSDMTDVISNWRQQDDTLSGQKYMNTPVHILLCTFDPGLFLLVPIKRNLKSNSFTFWEIRLFSFFLRIR